ncbi:hypothetical protein BS50DRAFT_334877 [Corynespora cassiicola Philippines]|uniref:Uncharacterized protein n=1 Tax=Corynespora cassiicola Philippines TaxID=1448308 RepID=A0A2T2NUV6_CORCC|nr:hypothetical protein BS50DRAFT_334877 [Corynespora cassiicola Philippines]
MRSAVILSLTGSTLAIPFGGFFNGVFGDVQERDVPPPDAFPFPPIGTGSGAVPSGTSFPTGHAFQARGVSSGFALPTGTGLPTGFQARGVPVGTGTGFPWPAPTGDSDQHEALNKRFRKLQIDYKLAPRSETSIIIIPSPVAADVRAAEKKQLGTGTPALPSFSLFNPSNTPAPSIPSGALPGAPELPLPTGGAPGLPELPTTLETLTRGPKTTPTGLPKLPEIPGEGEGNWWEQE